MKLQPSSSKTYQKRHTLYYLHYTVHMVNSLPHKITSPFQDFALANLLVLQLLLLLFLLRISQPLLPE